MDPDLQFPNPVERHDLPVPRKKWKYVLGGGLALVLLAGIFLPQILSSKVGKNLLKAYLESRYRGQAFMTTFKTSWWGPTTVTKFSLTDPEGRQIRFNSLSSPIGLGGLLFGTLDLGEAQVEGLYVEYVVDYGDGTDSIDRWPKSFDPRTNSAIKTPGTGPGTKLPELPDVSGKLTLTNTQIVLTRGQIMPRQFRPIYRSMRFVAPEGRLEIAALDRPWTVEMSGRVGPEDQPGRFSVNGTVDLGEEGKLNWNEAAIDLSVSMRDVPNVVSDETGAIGWLLFPMVSAEGHQRAMGNLIKRFDLHVKGKEGEWVFETLEAEGQTVDGKETKFAARPVLELGQSPRMLLIEEPATISAALTADMAGYLSYINPFLRDSANGTGWVELTIQQAKLPMSASAKTLSAQGEVAVQHAALASGQVMEIDPWPKELTTQWQAVVGNVGPSPVMQMPRARFRVENSTVSVEPYEVMIDGLPVKLSGEVSLKENRLKMEAKLASAQGGATISPGMATAVDAEIGGTLEAPKLTVKAASSEVASAFEKNLLALRQRKSEQLLQMSSKQVEGLLEVYDRIRNREEGGKE